MIVLYKSLILNNSKTNEREMEIMLEKEQIVKTAIMTDSNSGITQTEGEQLGITVVPMPFFINQELYYEDITLSQEKFYKFLENEDVEVSTSMPTLGDIQDIWDRLLKEYEEVVYIPMSSGLSGSYEAASFLAEDSYSGRVEVVNNQRISVTLRQSVLDAKQMAEHGWSAKRIREYLEKTKFDSSIYITLDTLKYLKKGGRVTPAAASIATVLNIKPVLQIQGEKLDSYAKTRSFNKAKDIMLSAVEYDIRERFGGDKQDIWIAVAYSGDRTAADEWKKELQEIYPYNEIVVNPLSLSVSCHIGSGALAILCSKKIPDDLFDEDLKLLDM